MAHGQYALINLVCAHNLSPLLAAAYLLASVVVYLQCDAVS